MELEVVSNNYSSVLVGHVYRCKRLAKWLVLFIAIDVMAYRTSIHVMHILWANQVSEILSGHVWFVHSNNDKTEWYFVFTMVYHHGHKTSYAYEEWLIDSLLNMLKQGTSDYMSFYCIVYVSPCNHTAHHNLSRHHWSWRRLRTTCKSINNHGCMELTKWFTTAIKCPLLGFRNKPCTH